MARKTQYEGSNLVWVTGAIMVAVTLYQGSKNTYNIAQKKKVAGKLNQQFDTTTKQLLAIALLVIVMSIVNDQVPEFGKPFTLLVLVAFLITKTPVIKDYFATTQGTNK